MCSLTTGMCSLTIGMCSLLQRSVPLHHVCVENVFAYYRNVFSYYRNVFSFAAICALAPCLPPPHIWYMIYDIWHMIYDIWCVYIYEYISSSCTMPAASHEMRSFVSLPNQANPCNPCGKRALSTRQKSPIYTTKEADEPSHTCEASHTSAMIIPRLHQWG